MSSICKYCNKVELVFDNAFKAKSGKLIPLDKQSGMPHQCSENPYSQQQQHQQSQQQAKQQEAYEKSVDDGISAFGMMSSLIVLVEQIQKQVVTIDNKLNRLLNLAELRK